MAGGLAVEAALAATRVKDAVAVEAKEAVPAAAAWVEAAA